jgi:acyl-CoA synthetase (AMP-forming)/AMP-acid ligase II
MRLHDFLDYQAREHPDNEFAIHRGRRISYREALLESNRFANAFVRAGLRIGDRVAFLSRNSIEHVLLYFAASKAGVVPVPLNFRLPPAQWVFLINDAEARILIAAGEYARAVETVRHEIGPVERYVAIAPPTHPSWLDYHSWLADEPDSPPDRLVTRDGDVYQFYTSGTTGRPKGAVITHGALIAHLVQLAAIYQIQPGWRILVITPLSHAHAAIQAFVSAYWGGCVYLMDEFDPAETVRVLSEERIGLAVLVPAIIRACLAAVPDVGARRFDRLQLIMYGASPIAEQTLRRAIGIFHCDFVQGYGMTETTAGVTFLLPGDHKRGLAERPALLTSAGRPTVGTEVRVVDDHDTGVPAGAVGQVIARGPTLMRGYWKLPGESAEVLRGGWMHTGDLGFMDDEGYLYIVDRANDVIVSGGENVYPRMVEEVLFQHPAVADAAAIGVPDDQWGEAVKAIVVLRAGAMVTAADIVEFCRGRLSGFQQPRSIDFREALPYTTSGKILRRTLREPYWARHGRRVSGA